MCSMKQFFINGANIKAGFPCYVASFPCDYLVQDAMKILSKTVACQGNNLKIIKIYYDGVQKIAIDARSDEWIYHNAFLPIINIELRKMDETTQVFMSFQMKKGTKVLLKLYLALVLLFEISWLLYLIMNKLAISVLWCVPVGMLIFVYAFSFVGFFISSWRVLKIIFSAFSGDDSI